MPMKGKMRRPAMNRAPGGDWSPHKFSRDWLCCVTCWLQSFRSAGGYLHAASRPSCQPARWEVQTGSPLVSLVSRENYDCLV